jgi:flagellar motor component MotA
LRSTYKLFVGMVVYLTWIVAVAVSAGLALGALWGVSSAVVVPAVGVYALLLLQHWQFAWRDARRFFVLRSRRELVAAMRERQRLLGARLDQAYRAFVDGGAV